MLKKLYEKSQIVFAIAWIIGYVVLVSAGGKGENRDYQS